MCVWWGKSGYDAGIGKSENSIRSRDVLMCSERYAEDIPLRFPNTQFPPTRSLASKQSNAKPRSFSALTAAIPDDPAPTTQTLGSPLCSSIASTVAEVDGGVTVIGCEDGAHGLRGCRG